jgi:hypothetical protein
MSNPRIPALPVTLPNGDLDCPESIDDDMIAERKAEIVAEASRLYGTPPDVLERERQRAEELEHARVLAHVRGRKVVPRVKPKTLTPKQKHLRNIRAVLAKAPKNVSNQELSDYYHRARLRPPKKWGIAFYPDVWGNKKVESKFRKEKSEALRVKET